MNHNNMLNIIPAYFSPMGNLEKHIEMPTLLNNAKKTVEEKFSQVTIDFLGTSITRLGIGGQNRLKYCFKIRGDETYLLNAFDQFINQAGLPEFIGSGSDYRLADRVLSDYGKKTKRKMDWCTDGKWVVDN